MFKKQICDTTEVFAYISGEGGSINVGGCSVAW